MIRFIQYYSTDIPGRLTRKLASDGYCPLDGRTGLMTAHSVAIVHARKIQAVAGDIIGYDIRRGDIRSNRPITNPLPIPGREAEFNAAMAKGIVQ
ncbi:MAG: hypothetical protein E6Q77_06555 [Rhizobium sp.]|nr:MAG: hypothetical protein E6Q77_06555 [Rhizobium sp.]